GDQAHGEQQEQNAHEDEPGPRRRRPHGRTSTSGAEPRSTTTGLSRPSAAVRRRTKPRASTYVAPSSGGCSAPSVPTTASTASPSTPSTSGCRLATPAAR